LLSPFGIRKAQNRKALKLENEIDGEGKCNSNFCAPDQLTKRMSFFQLAPCPKTKAESSIVESVSELSLILSFFFLLGVKQKRRDGGVF
jgi:hypothetical protein